MRTVVLLDTKIDKDEALALLDEYSDWFEEITGIECTWWVERRDFSQVPTSPDNDGDLKPTHEYRQTLSKDVHSRYNTYGTDNILMWVHEDNFLFKGIWGVNFSYSHFKYCFQLCRWDKDNDANTFGTLYHEQMHSFDAVIKNEIGFDVDPMFGVHWDSIVHGINDWDYIRYKENTEALERIASYLKRAYKARKDKHDKYFSLLKQVVKLLSTLVALLSKKK